MNFELTEEHLAVREAARDFAQNVLKPGVIERDRDQRFPTEEIKQLAELGFRYSGDQISMILYPPSNDLSESVLIICLADALEMLSCFFSKLFL